MYLAIIRPKKRKSVLAFAMALGLGLSSPAQGYLLDFTVASIYPEVLVSGAAGCSLRTPPAGSDPEGADVSRRGDPGHQINPANTFLNRILTLPTGPLADYVATVAAAAAAFREVSSGLSPQGSLPLQGSVLSGKHNDCLPVLSGFPGATADGSFDYWFAGSFASPAGTSGSAMTPSDNILHHLAPFSSALVLLGSGLMGLVGLGYRRRRG